MKKTILVMCFLLFVISPVFAEKISLGGKIGISYWYEDYERKGFGGICWFNDWLGAELLLNIDTTSFHDAGGYAGKLKIPWVIKADDNMFFEITPTVFYRYDNRNPTVSTTTTVSPGIWTGIEMFALEQMKNVSFNIAAGVDYTFVTKDYPNGTSTLDRQLNISIFALGVRYYF